MMTFLALLFHGLLATELVSTTNTLLGYTIKSNSPLKTHFVQEGERYNMKQNEAQSACAESTNKGSN